MPSATNQHKHWLNTGDIARLVDQVGGGVIEVVVDRTRKLGAFVIAREVIADGAVMPRILGEGWVQLGHALTLGVHAQHFDQPICIEVAGVRVGSALILIHATQAVAVERVDLDQQINHADLDALFSRQDQLVEDESEAQA